MDKLQNIAFSLDFLQSQGFQIEELFYELSVLEVIGKVYWVGDIEIGEVKVQMLREQYIKYVEKWDVPHPDFIS